MIRLSKTETALEDHVDRFCGSALNCISGESARETIIAEAGSPFNIYVNLDKKDPMSEADNYGFSIDYLQLPC